MTDADIRKLRQLVDDNKKVMYSGYYKVNKVEGYVAWVQYDREVFTIDLAFQNIDYFSVNIPLSQIKKGLQPQ